MQSAIECNVGRSEIIADNVCFRYQLGIEGLSTNQRHSSGLNEATDR